jgi:hypothetical protein
MTFTHSFHSPVLLALIFASAALLPMSLSAQQAPLGNSDVTAAEAPIAAAAIAAVPLPGPRLQATSFTYVAPADLTGVSAPQNRVHAGTDVAMMAVGGAGLVVGLLIGGDSGVLIASTGGVIGLIGLFRYLR